VNSVNFQPSIGSNARMLRRNEAAQYLGCSVGFLEKAAVRGDGPPMLRLSRRMIVYDPNDLDAWAASRRVASTSSAGEGR
jgi:predicted DNA-binding transcriptional regulator AlpA